MGIANITTVKFGAEPAIVLADGLFISPGEIGGATTFDVVDEEQFLIVDFVAVCFGTKPTIDRASASAN